MGRKSRLRSKLPCSQPLSAGASQGCDHRNEAQGRLPVLPSRTVTRLRQQIEEQKSDLSGSSTDSPTPPVHPAGQVYILWDFDQTYGWGKARTVAVYQAILERLLRDGFVANKAQPNATAYGTLDSLRDRWVVQALNEMNVVVKLQSGLKKEEVDGQLERDAEALAALPATATLAIVSSDKGFSRLIRSLVQKGKRTVLFHEAPAGSPHEQILCLYVDRAYRLEELGVASLKPTLPLSTALCHGTITDIRLDRNRAPFGHIRDSSSGQHHFFHSQSVASNVAIRPGLAVSFKLAPDPKDPGGSIAIHVDMDAQPTSVMRHGTVKKWDVVKKFGFIAEKGESRDVYFRLDTWQGAQPPVVGAEVDFAAEDHRGRNDRRFGTIVAPAAGPSAPHPLQPPRSSEGALPPFGTLSAWNPPSLAPSMQPRAGQPSNTGPGVPLESLVPRGPVDRAHTLRLPPVRP